MCAEYNENRRRDDDGPAGAVIPYMNTEGIKQIFSEAAATYEVVNHVLTFGLDRAWRKKAAGEAAQAGQGLWLDACSGTGDMALSLSRLAGEDTTIIASDMNLPMLRKAFSKFGKSGAKTVRFCISDSRHLPFADEAFDLVTIAFATRNLNINRDALLQCFREFRRVLKPGGIFVNLETSQPASKILRCLFHTYVRLFVTPVGYAISGSKAAYTYLSSTIPRFFGAPELSDMLYEAGFIRVKFSRLTLGVCAIHTAVR